MREFEYFLFENFDLDGEADIAKDPRLYLGKRSDPILSEVAQRPVGKCLYGMSCDAYGTQIIDDLIYVGVLRKDGEGLFFDCPVFLREDASVLHTHIASKAAVLVDVLQDEMANIRECCAGINNGFSVEIDLYHILCGKIFDGLFFDYLSAKGVLATSRKHSSGLDYLNVIYEKCGELQTLSDGLLCSYNRLVDPKCALQSFGDANGSRFDFYRFFRSIDHGTVPAHFTDVKALIDMLPGTDPQNTLLSGVASLILEGSCSPKVMELLERFGYAEKGEICVPVYTPDHRRVILEIEHIVEDCLGDLMANTLLDLAASIDITAVRHGVDRLQIANELYHILFGTINEELVLREIVAAPPHIDGEGRYFKCIEVY